MKNVVKIFGIPMSSLGGVHLISGIDHCGKLLYLWIFFGMNRANYHYCAFTPQEHKCLPD